MGGSSLGMSGSPGQGQSGVGVPMPNLGFDMSQSGNSSRNGPQSQSGGPGGKNGQRSPKSQRPNWALPNAKVNSIGVTRPIHVTILPDRLVIVPEQGDDRRPQVFSISQQLSPQEVDAFVTAVQKEMQSWGLAVQNGFWKPRIVMDVDPNAEQHCRDLQMALENSGFEMQRKLR
jgi:hypothetical protein